jgi:colanic acid/amylovoran biosynthesis glycosyltransferase
MRLGYVLRWWPTRSETFVAREVEALRAIGHQVDVVSMGHRADVPGPDPRAIAMPRGRAWARAIPDLRAVAGVARDAEVPPRQAARIAWLAGIGRQRGWERLVAHFAGEAAELAVPAAALLGVPCAVVAHAVDVFRPRPSLPGVLRAARPLVTVCAHHRDFLWRHYGAEAVVVRCRVPLRVPRADPAGPGPTRWVSVARDVPKKGLDDLAAVFGAAEVGRLRLVSDAVRLGGPRILAGPLAPAAVPEVLARAHGFVLPCRVAPDGDRDGVPVALLEAMAAGLPVVATPVSGLAEVVDDEVGWVVPPGDRAALARALADAAADPAARAARGAAARARVEASGDPEQQARELLAAFAG